jgi:hypothetical protein
MSYPLFLINFNSRCRCFLILLIVYLAPFFDLKASDEFQYNSEINPLSIILNDTYLIAGITNSGIYYSPNFRNLSYISGFIFGAEQYIPMQRKMFLSIGINLAQSNFSHQYENSRINFRNTYLDFPIYSSFELPILRDFDFRLILGVKAGIRLASSKSDDYSISYTNEEDNFTYDLIDFHRIDFGWSFGISAEYMDFILKAIGYSGFNNIDSKAQGMMNSFSFQIGYFLFRNLKIE